MTGSALLVVDMIEAYLSPGGPLFCEAAQAIVPVINKLAEATRRSDGLVVFANTTLSSPDDPIARRWGMHAVAGTEGPKVWRDIDQAASDLVIPKTSYNSFFRTSLDDDLRAHGVEAVAVVGIHTHVCVLLTAAAASDYGYDVTALEDAMTTSYRPNHDTRLRFFSTHLGTLTDSAGYINQLQ